MDGGWIFGWCLALMLLPNTVGGQIRVTATPMQSRTPNLRFPRVSGLHNAEVQRQVNAILAKRQREDIGTLRECRRGIPGPPQKDEDSERVRVTYLSPLFLSIDTRMTVWQCAPYPQIDVPHPLSINLQTGAEVDWGALFSDGFLPVPDDSVHPPANLIGLYLMHYTQDQECIDAVKAGQYGFDLWLDHRRKALVAIPHFSHQVWACADEVAIPFSEVLPYVADKAAASDLAR
jgi:hypothetical protein